MDKLLKLLTLVLQDYIMNWDPLLQESAAQVTDYTIPAFHEL